MRLARSPEQINIGDVVRGAEEDLAVVECFQEGNFSCPIVPACTLRGVLEHAMRAFFDVLDRYTLQDLLQRQTELRKIFRNAGLST